jgi:YD repeat-containing protein
MKMRKVLQGLVMVLVVLLSYTLLATQGPQVCQFDYNGDGDVDGQDLAQFLSEFDVEDLGLIAGEFGRSNCAVFPLYPEDVDYGLATDEQQGGGGLVGESVRILNGNTIEYRTDLSFASPHSYGLSFSATYNSQSDTLSALGFGWTHTYDLTLVADFYFSGKSYLKIVDETGRGVYFEQEAPDMYRGAFHEKTYVTLDTTDYVWHRLDGSQYGFSDSGKLIWIEDEKSNRLEISYDGQDRLETVTDTAGGRVLTFNYDDDTDLIESISGPDTEEVADGIWVRFYYDEKQNLDLVTYADGSGVDYEYTDPEDEHNLTEKRNTAAHLINTWSYDNQDRCEQNYSPRGRGVSIKYISDALMKVTDAYGVVRSYSIENTGGRKRVSSMQGLASAPYTDSNAIGWVYDEQMNLIEVQYANATIDQYLDYDTRGIPWTVVLAAGETEDRTVTYTYHPDMNVVLTRTEPSVLGAGSKVTIWDYDDDYDTTPNENPTNLVSRIVEQGFSNNTVGQTVAYEYVTTYTYNAQGQVLTIDGPRTDVSDVTTFTYYSNGDLESVTYPLIGAGYFDNYDNAGQPGRITDVNAQSTQLTYDGRGRITTVTHDADSSSATATYISGLLDNTLDEDGVTRDYEYESVYGHLYRIYDVENNYIQYLYDARGNLTEKSTHDPTSQRYSRKRWDYLSPDIKGKLWKEINFDDTYTEHRYFSDGNLKSKTDPENRTSQYTYDALNRLKTVAQTHINPGDTITTYAYDEHGNLASVTDAHGHQTTYTYDDMGRVVASTSADTGTTTYVYDEVGNLAQKTDANGVTTTYNYDALNRLTTVDFPLDVDITYSYDAGTNGKGHRTGMNDASGNTTFAYDSRGRLVDKTSTVNGYSTVNYQLTRTFTPGRRLELVTYPSGRTVDFTRYVNTGKIEKIQTTFSTKTKSLVSNLAYNPFGGATSMDTGSGGSIYNQQSECACLETANPGSLMEQVYTYYDDGNLETITGTCSPWLSQDFDYDNLGRLKHAAGNYGTIDFTYDKVGNRKTRTINGHTDIYSYLANTNRLDRITGANPATFAYDDNGNITAIDTRIFVYNQNNRLIRVENGMDIVAEYIYNGLGQRVLKDAGGIITVFHYGLSLRL